jgi:hypothetical protein
MGCNGAQAIDRRFPARARNRKNTRHRISVSIGTTCSPPPSAHRHPGRSAHPDSTGFGDYTETGQVIPVSVRGRKGSYTHCMFLNDEGPIAGGRELWSFPKKLALPSLHAEIDTLVGKLEYGPVRVATGTMGYKHKAADPAAIKARA